MTPHYFRVVLASCALAAGCGDNVVGQVVVLAPSSVIEPVRGIAALIAPTAPLAVRESADPAAEVTPDRDLRIGIVIDLDCTECYRIDAVAPDRAWLVHAGDLLGAQYGVAHALENLGFRFRHPYATYAPPVPAFDPAAAPSLGVLHEPDIAVRGFQFHTLHPIEPHYALWLPSQHGLDEAARIFSWVAANRGNYVQWVGLDDIMVPEQLALWQPHTARLIEMAHARGLRAGLNVQLFGQSNIQRGFDLSDDDTGTVPLADELAERLPKIIDGVPFDTYVLSFGEFFSADPDRFVQSINEAAAGFNARTPAEVHALIHVGDEQRVDYMGEKDLLYYFLVKFADPSIIPEIHTVMFYNLYEDAGGAYHHDNFDEHRAYLMTRLAAGQPVVYQPETAYWVAFDNSVPLYLPLYVRSRWLDLERIATDPAAGGNPLTGHILFSTGWEWGYWLHDYAALRASYDRPADWRALIADAFGADLAPAVDVVAGLIEDQKRELIDGRLIAYIAGRDASIEVGRILDIVSQPDRVRFEDLAADPALRAPFAADILPRLDALADTFAARADQVDALAIDGIWADELRQATRITTVRARYAATGYRTVLDHLAGNTAGAQAGLARMNELIAQAEPILAARRIALHWPDRATLLERGGNATLYGYGYLYHADTLCFWHRERVELERIMGLTSDAVPGCLL